MNLPRWPLVCLTAAIVYAGQLSAQARGISWAPPPTIAAWAPDTIEMYDIAEVASADWPTMYVEWLAAVRHCSRLYADLREWTLWTVTAQSFFVDVRDDSGEWHRRQQAFQGFTFPQLKRIYVVQYGRNSAGLIQHEMLHAILAEKGFDPRHNTAVAEGMFARCFSR